MIRVMRKLNLVLMIVFLLVSCGNITKGEKVKEEVTKEVKYKYSSMKDSILYLDVKEARKHPKELKLSELCDSLIYVQLETNRKCLIGDHIHKIKIDGNDIFIHESSRLLHFNIKGKFLGEIGRKGRGPHEYVCADFCLDRINKVVYAHANYKHKIMMFSYNGKFLSDTLKFNSHTNGMEFITNEKSIFGASNYSLNKRSGDYNILEGVDCKRNVMIANKSKYFPNKFFDTNGPQVGYFPASCIYQYGSKLYYQEFASDTVFVRTNAGNSPYIIFKGRNENRLIHSNFTEDTMNLYIKYSFLIKGESDRYIFFGGLSPESFLFDKVYKEFCKINGSDYLIYNDLDNVSHFYDLETYDNRYLLRISEAFSLMNKLTNEQRKKIKISNINEESNPVLLLGRLL